MDEMTECPQCGRECTTQDIIDFGWCLLCEDVNEEIQTDKYYKKKGIDNDMGYE